MAPKDTPYSLPNMRAGPQSYGTLTECSTIGTPPTVPRNVSYLPPHKSAAPQPPASSVRRSTSKAPPMPSFSTANAHSKPWKRVKTLEAEIDNGSSQNSGIYIVRNKQTDTIAVEKCMRLEDMRSGDAQRELEAMKLVKGHNNLVYLIETWTDVKRVNGSLILEYYDLGTLGNMIEDNYRRKKSFDLFFIFEGMRSIAGGLDFMRNGPSGTKEGEWDWIVHRDIKPDNIFMSSIHPGSKYPRFVLGDFGCCVTRSQVDRRQSKMHDGSRDRYNFSPPEAPRWYFTSDVYQLALCLVCACFPESLLCDRVPVRKAVADMPYPICLKHILRQMLIVDPYKRKMPSWIEARAACIMESEEERERYVDPWELALQEADFLLPKRGQETFEPSGHLRNCSCFDG